MLSSIRDLYDGTRFRRMLSWIAGIAGVGWIGLVVLAEASLGGQRLWLSRSVVDLGRLEPNTRATARVWIINPTGQRIALYPVAGCGCTVAGLRKGVLLPIDVTTIDIQVETFGGTGAYRRRVHLICQAGSRAWREPIEVRYTVKEGGK